MTTHTLVPLLLPLVLATSPVRAQVPAVVIAPDIDVVIAQDDDAPAGRDIDVTIAPVVNVAIVSAAPPPAAVPSVPPVVTVRRVQTTELHFASADDEQYVISVYREEPQWDYEPLCVTPCTIDIENGMYDFMAGGHRTFQVYAIGGVQYWSVEDNNMAGIIAGSVMTGLGGVTTLVGGIMSGDDSSDSYDSYSYDSYDEYGIGHDDVNPGYVVLGVGAGVASLGLLIWLFSYGSAEQTSPTEGFIPVAEGVGILPTVYSNQGTAGDREWGLGLGVRF